MQVSRRLLAKGEGGATSTELAVLMPVLIVLVMLLVQVGLWWHAKQAAEVAAEEAVDAAKFATATTADGEAGAAAILSQAGNLRNVTVTVNRGAEAVTVDIQGDLGFSVFPGGWSVRAHAEAPIERFIPEPER